MKTNLSSFLVAVVIIIATGQSVNAQVSINNDNSAPDNSAMLDVKSANKGFLPPRIALTAINSSVPIVSPANGIIVYNTNTSGTVPNNVSPGYYYWNGTKWISLTVPQGTNLGDMLYWDGTQWVVIPAGTNGQSLIINNGVPTWWGHYSAQLPSVATDIITNILSNSAVSGGCMIDGGAAIFAKGLCWSNSPNPTTADSKTFDGIGPSCFSSSMTGLIQDTTYYVRAYATNSVGTGYGNQYSFTTQDGIVSLTTTSIGEITNNSAKSGGNITTDGGAGVTARGICWNTTTNPTILNNHTTDGSGTGTFVSNLTGLSGNTLYFVRSYAINSVGTYYGNEISFSTFPTCGDSIIITHLSGAVAPVNKTVTYGTVSNIPGLLTKCWITSNLGADHQAISATDATEASAGWYWQFNRKQGYKHDGTTLTPNNIWITSIDEDLNWQAVNDPCAIELGFGWRIPTYSEWTNVDNDGNWNNLNHAWSSLLKLHAAGYIWNGGGLLGGRGGSGTNWSTDQGNTLTGSAIYFDPSDCKINSHNKADGHSLRCIRDF